MSVLQESRVESVPVHGEIRKSRKVPSEVRCSGTRDFCPDNSPGTLASLGGGETHRCIVFQRFLPPLSYPLNNGRINDEKLRCGTTFSICISRAIAPRNVTARKLKPEIGRGWLLLTSLSNGNAPQESLAIDTRRIFWRRARLSMWWFENSALQVGFFKTVRHFPEVRC